MNVLNQKWVFAQIQILQQITAQFLLLLDCCEQCLEVAGAETLVILALDDLDEQCWSILHWTIIRISIRNESFTLTNHVFFHKCENMPSLLS